MTVSPGPSLGGGLPGVFLMIRLRLWVLGQRTPEAKSHFHRIISRARAGAVSPSPLWTSVTWPRSHSVLSKAFFYRGEYQTYKSREVSQGCTWTFVKEPGRSFTGRLCVTAASYCLTALLVERPMKSRLGSLRIHDCCVHFILLISKRH